MSGYRVLVPFRGKTVWGIAVRSPYQGRVAGVRDLVNWDASRCLVAPDILELVTWVANYYRAPLGEVIKMALPPGSLNAKPSSYRLTQAGRDWIDRHPDQEAAHLLDKLRNPQTRLRWEQATQTRIPLSAIREWEDAGLIALQRRDHQVLPVIDVVRLAPGAPSELGLQRAPKQRVIVDYLRKRGDSWVSVPQMRADLAVTAAMLTALTGKGLIERGQMDEMALEHQATSVRPSRHTMTGEQRRAYEPIAEAMDGHSFKVFLLFGITGSGKTEVYLNAIERCLASGRQALFLVPEISLTPMMKHRIQDRFGSRLAILHSAIGKRRRAGEWARVLSGKADVVLGARSAVFAPLPRLGLVIVDEEHDGSYKQTDGVRYQARSLALMRARRSKAAVVLGSATPSLESWYLAQTGKYHLLRMTQRANAAMLPAVEIVDMREEFKRQRRRFLFSTALMKRLDLAVESGQQAMILINRRGFHSFLLCRKCGEAVMCHQCEVSLTYHRVTHQLHCHYCDVRREVPNQCPACAAEAASLQFFGEGTQQVASELAARFGEEQVDRMDRDRLTAGNGHQAILDRFRCGTTKILVGTQMIAKGHDFPNVTVVGIINADIALRVPDFRAAESTFQLITQIAGRSGRGELPGHVIVQTYMPEHYSVQSAAAHDFEAFVEREQVYRQRLFYPPYAAMVQILVRHRDQARARQASDWIGHELARHQQGRRLVVLGPSPAPLAKVKNIHRFQILLKSDHRSWMHELAVRVIEAAGRAKIVAPTDVVLDVDPSQFS